MCIYNIGCLDVSSGSKHGSLKASEFYIHSCLDEDPSSIMLRLHHRKIHRIFIRGRRLKPSIYLKNGDFPIKNGDFPLKMVIFEVCEWE